MFRFTLLLLLCGATHALFAQTISGRVTDDVGKGVEFATVTLLKANDSTLVKGEITDAQGGFSFEKIAFGRFFVRVSQLGYATFSSPVFVLNSETPSIHLRSLALTQAAQNLNEVTVRSTKPFIERQLDKTIVNVENSIVSAGSNALEVLERSPGVVIDQNDNLSLKGKQGVVVMINGKPSVISNQDLANYLRGLPANTLEKIEIITNPSAKYDHH